MTPAVLLEIQSSVRQQASISRQLSAEFIQVWRSRYPQAKHLIRDVGVSPPAHPTEVFTIAKYTPFSQRTPEMIAVLSNSDALIDEFLTADYLVSVSCHDYHALMHRSFAPCPHST